MNKIYIGIDTGVNTGIAIWNQADRRLLRVETMKIHEAMKLVELYIKISGKDEIVVRFEDARLRKWFGKSGREQLQGAGSIRRDCTIWNDFLDDLGIEYKAVAPKDNRTKLSADTFNKITGWKGRTSEHARDAAMLIYGI